MAVLAWRWGAISALLVVTGYSQDSPSTAAASPSPVTPDAALDTTLVKGTRDVGKAHDLPYTITLLPESTLEERLVRTLPEALERTPGVMVQKTANGQGSPFIRGFTGYRTLALVDGVRYNNSIYRDGPNEYYTLIDAQALESIELIQGPASVLYGSDAIGGALYLNTKHSGYLLEPEGQSFVHGTNLYRWHSAERSHSERLEFQTGVGGKWGLHLGASVRNYGDLIAADFGELPHTGYDEWAYDVRFDASLNEFWTLTLAHQRLEQDDVWRTHATIHGISFAGSEVGEDLRRLKDQQRQLSYARLTGEDLGAFVDRAVFTVSYQNWQEDGDRIRNNGRRELEYLDSGMWGFDLQLESDTPIGRLTYGLDYYEDHVDTARSDYEPDGTLRERKIQGPVGDDTVYGQFGAYVQDTIELGDRLDVIAGGRFDSVRADIGRYEDPLTGGAESLSEDWQNVVGSLRAIYDLDAGARFKWFGGASQAFRAPNTADLTRFGASRSDEIESAAARLEPEHFLTFETGLKVDTGTVAGGFSFFHARISDFITSTPTGRIVDGQREVTKQNSAEGFVRGIESWADWEIGGGFSVFGNLTWIEGEADTFPDPVTGRAVREAMSRIQPLTGTGGVRWTGFDDRFWIECAATAAARADELNTADRGDTQRIPPGGTPGYTLLDLRAGWTPNEHLTLYGGLENLLDEAYRTHGSGSNEPGFGGVLGVKVMF
jgi:hemoglobin/transferrin/lactoferrin receptor protein